MILELSAWQAIESLERSQLIDLEEVAGRSFDISLPLATIEKD